MTDAKDTVGRINEFLDLLELAVGKIDPIKRGRLAVVLTKLIGDERIEAVTTAAKHILATVPGGEKTARQIDKDVEEFNEQRRRD